MVVLLFLHTLDLRRKTSAVICITAVFHGICFTNHQTLIVAPLASRIAIAAGIPARRFLILGKQHHLP